MLAFPSFFIAFVGALVMAIIPRRFMASASMVLPVALFAHLAFTWQNPLSYDVTIAGLSVLLVSAQEVFVGAPFFMWALALLAVLGGIYQSSSKNRVEHSAVLLYFGAAMAVISTGNLLVMLVFWEIMALASSAIIFGRRSAESGPAALRYLYMHMLGGIFLMLGIAGHVFTTGSFEMTAIPAASEMLLGFSDYDLHSMSLWFMVVGIIINTAAIPFSAWLSDAYPKASAFGTVFLSAATTKTAIFVLAVIFPGVSFLIWLGLLTAIYGTIYALIQSDLRKMYAYSIISQVGLMMIAVGVGTAEALMAVSMHAFAHIMYKSLVMMSAGAVLHVHHRVTFEDIKGLHRTMPIAAAGLLVGGLALSAVPLTVGFISKTALSTSIAHYGDAWLWYGFVALSAGTFLYAFMRVAWAIFTPCSIGVAEILKATKLAKELPWSMNASIIMLGVICVSLGLPGAADYLITIIIAEPVALVQALPAELKNVTSDLATTKILASSAVSGDVSSAKEALVYSLLASPFAAYKIIGQMQLLFGGAVIYLLLGRYLQAPRNTKVPDWDWFYRSLPLGIVNAIGGGKHFLSMKEAFAAGLRKRLENMSQRMEGTMLFETLTARHWGIGTTATLMFALLGLYLALYYV